MMRPSSTVQRMGAAQSCDNPGSIVLPDYQGGSIVNLLVSIVTACGGRPSGLYPPLSAVSVEEWSGCRNVVLMVIDGMGHDLVCGKSAGGALHSRLRGRLTSVFPSTTASAITTFLTGVAPQQHAMTGWFMYFRELAGVYAVLPGRPRCGGCTFSRCGIDPRTVFDTEPVFDALPGDAVIVIPRRIVQSDYNLAYRGKAELRCYDSLDEFFHTTSRALAEPAAGTRFVYAYWPDLDSVGHEYGIGHREAASHLAQIDDRFGRFCKQLAGSDTLVIVTADHGMIDTDREHKIKLADHPELAECLLLPLCGERRACYCYVRHNRADRFESYLNSELAHAADWIASEDFLARGAFGCGRAHPKLAERIGDYVLLMKECYVLEDWLPGESRYEHIGVHGGVSESEMFVPLIAARL